MIRYDAERIYSKVERDSEFMINTKQNRISGLESEMADHLQKIERYNDEDGLKSNLNLMIGLAIQIN